MRTFDEIPYQEPLFSTAQACAILAVKRNTLAAQLARYDDQLRAIGIEPGSQGVARSFTLEQLGLFAAIRSAFPIGQSKAVLEALDAIAGRASELYSELFAGLCSGAARNRDGKIEEYPDLPQPQRPHHLQGLNLFGLWSFTVQDKAPSEAGYSVADLAGYPLPIIILPLDATLRAAWKRALHVRNKIPLDDVPGGIEREAQEA